MKESKTPSTSLCRHTSDAIYVRERDLCRDLIGKVTFTEMIFLDILGSKPTAVETAVLDAVLVTLMEHGLAPSAIATRLTYSSAPESLQGAVAAGLLGAGSVLLGTLETSALLLDQIVADPLGFEVAAQREAQGYKERREPVPGFGHPHHKPDDPRTVRLFVLADELQLPGQYIAACRALSQAVDRAFGKHIVLNASAAIAAMLREIDVPTGIIRGFAVICRAAGLVAHVREEQLGATAWAMTRAAADAIPYVAAAPPSSE